MVQPKRWVLVGEPRDVGDHPQAPSGDTEQQVVETMLIRSVSDRVSSKVCWPTTLRKVVWAIWLIGLIV